MFGAIGQGHPLPATLSQTSLNNNDNNMSNNVKLSGLQHLIVERFVSFID
jgi:hypothetical protein